MQGIYYWLQKHSTPKSIQLIAFTYMHEMLDVAADLIVIAHMYTNTIPQFYPRIILLRL